MILKIVKLVLVMVAVVVVRLTVFTRAESTTEAAPVGPLEDYEAANGGNFSGIDGYFNWSTRSDEYVDYEDESEDALEKFKKGARVQPHHHKFIVISSLIFFAGLVGNALVCMAVYRNHSMRNVTNYFIVNLAIADLLVIIVCLPSTVVWDITQTWYLGSVCCKIILYLQVLLGLLLIAFTFIYLFLILIIIFIIFYVGRSNN